MKKIISLMSLLLVWATSLPAQIMQEQADAIVLDYLKNEVMHSGLLYINDKAPGVEDIAITTSNKETFKAKYACWAYYLNENESNRSRYLFVKEDNGSLLEIIANNDLGPGDLASWKAVETTTGLINRKSSAKQLYPNPVNDWLTIPCASESVRVEIYDLKGNCVFSGSLSGENACWLDVSFLSDGVYVVSVEGETHRIIKN